MQQTGVAATTTITCIAAADVQTVEQCLKHQEMGTQKQTQETKWNTQLEALQGRQEVRANLQHCHQLGCAAWQAYWLAAHPQPTQLQGAQVRLQPHAGLSWGQPPGPGLGHEGLSQQAPVQMESPAELQQQLMYLLILSQGLLSITTVAHATHDHTAISPVTAQACIC